MLTGIFTGNQKLDRNSNLIQLLNTTPEAFKAFEEAYYKASVAQGTSDNLFAISAKEISDFVMDSKQEFTPETLEIISRIVKELVAQTDVFVYDGNKHQVTIEDYTHLLPVVSAVSLDEIKALPKEMQPDLSGNLIKRDIPESGMMLLDHYNRFLKESNPKKKKLTYDIFSQGLDKERLGSNPLTCLMDHASVKMRNLEASSFKPNSPYQAHHEALASCVLDMLDLDRMSKTIPVSITECHCISLCVSVYTIFRISNKLYIRKGEKRKW